MNMGWQWARLVAVSLSVLSGATGAQAADLASAKAAYDQKDFETAAQEFLVLAAQGDREAQLAIGKMYMIGQAVKQDRDEAVKWFKAAAGAGSADAAFFLGAMYLLPQIDIPQGIKWLQQAANQGLQDAQYLLGKAYTQGADQLPRDPVQGAMWLKLAAKDNTEFSQTEVRAAESQMTPDQISKAAALVAAWKPSSRPDEPVKP